MAPRSDRGRKGGGAGAGPAESGPEALARLYDLDVSESDDDLGLYRALADRADGPVLELMAGSGRVAVPLAAAGHRVVAVDNDPVMLARARAAARAAGRGADLRLATVEADVDGFRHPRAGRFGLAFVALGSLLLLPERAAQRRAFCTLADHLAPDGVAAVDVPLLDADDLSRYDGRLTLEWVRQGSDGTIVTKTASGRHDPSTRTVDLVTIFEEAAPGRPLVRTVRMDRLTLLDAVDLAEMADEAGLRIEVLAGDADLGPLGPGSARAVMVATRARAPRVRAARGAAGGAAGGGASGAGTRGGRTSGGGEGTSGRSGRSDAA